MLTGGVMGKRINANVYTRRRFGKRLRETCGTENPFLYSGGSFVAETLAGDVLYLPIFMAGLLEP